MGSGPKRGTRRKRHLAALGTLLACLAATAVAAALDMPGRPLILSAADRLNSITPQGVPKQTITIGSYDAAKDKFSWALSDSYPPNTPPSKRADEGGPVQPQHVAEINSYNVTYRFLVTNASAGFHATLSFPDGHGGTTVVSAAPLNGVVSIAFHPQTLGLQLASLGSTRERITPSLQPQLGAFVVPYQLISLVYEPPGAASLASYDSSSTMGSTVAWSFEQSSGLVETESGDEMANFFADTVLPQAAGYANPVAGAVVGVIASLRSGSVDTITSTTANGQSASVGSTLSITQGFFTTRHHYPGKGDLYVILRDVLYAYVVRGGHVLLTPLAYSGVDPTYAEDLTAKLPARVAQAFLALDPLLTTQPGKQVTPPKSLLPGRVGQAPRFTFLESAQCTDAGQYLQVSQDQVQTSTVSKTTSQTSVEKTTGLIASIAGTPDTIWSQTMSTSTGQLSGHGTSAKLTLLCDPADEFSVDVYYDNIFRTFLTLETGSLAAQPAVSGTVSRPNGSLASHEQVTLTAAGHRYVASSDAKGRFSFRFTGLPTGNATLAAGASARQIKLGSAPLIGLELTS